MLAIYLALVTFAPGGLDTTIREAGFGALLSLLYVFNFGAAAGVTPEELGPLWTLSVEEQFYFLWPLLLVPLLFKKVRGNNIALGLGVAIVAIWVIRPITWMVSGNSIYNLPTTWMDALALGALLAVAKHYGFTPRFLKSKSTLRVLLPLSWGLVLGVIFMPEVKSSFWGYTLALPCLAVAMGVIVWVCAEPADSQIARFLAWRPLVWIGWLSYSLYLWNYLVREWAMGYVSESPWVLLAAGVPATFVLAWISFRFVETPALKMKDPIQRLLSARNDGETSSAEAPLHAIPERSFDVQRPNE